jgi:hypothetical protein
MNKWVQMIIFASKDAKKNRKKTPLYGKIYLTEKTVHKK